MVFKPGTGFASSNYVVDAKKLNPFRVHSMRSFNPHVGSFHSPTWGYQRHNSYRVAMLYSAFVMLYNTNYADNLSSVYPPRRFISFTNVGLSEAQLVPSCDVIQRVCDVI